MPQALQNQKPSQRFAGLASIAFPRAYILRVENNQSQVYSLCKHIRHIIILK